MQTFTQKVKGIAQAKVLSRACKKKTPNLTFNGLSYDQQISLALALIQEDESVREFIAEKITHAIEDAYCDELRPSEAIDDAIDLSNFAQEDVAQRTYDMNQAIQSI